MSGPIWFRVDREHPAAARLADAHYSRQTVGARGFLPPGRSLVLVTAQGDAVWGVVENMDPAGRRRWRVTIFRNESRHLSSDMVRAATQATYRVWWGEYREHPTPLTTEVDPRRVRRKRDPGRCFRRAGWRPTGRRRGLLHFAAPLAVLS